MVYFAHNSVTPIMGLRQAINAALSDVALTQGPLTLGYPAPDVMEANYRYLTSHYGEILEDQRGALVLRGKVASSYLLAQLVSELAETVNYPLFQDEIHTQLQYERQLEYLGECDIPDDLTVNDVWEALADLCILPFEDGAYYWLSDSDFETGIAHARERKQCAVIDGDGTTLATL